MEILYEVFYDYHKHHWVHTIEYRVNGYKYKITINSSKTSKFDDKVLLKYVYDEIKKNDKIIYVRRY